MRFGGLTPSTTCPSSAGRGEITALIGPNGAGKTTVFNCITGFYKPTEGMIQLRHPGRHRRSCWSAWTTSSITRHARVARTFQNIRLFSGMTVLENLMVAQHNTLMRGLGLHRSPACSAVRTTRRRNKQADREWPSTGWRRSA